MSASNPPLGPHKWTTIDVATGAVEIGSECAQLIADSCVICTYWNRWKLHCI